jgi:tetratricopeptide (TPR) repeat protein
LQTIYDESRKCDSQKDKQLAAKIAHDQDADQIVVLANIWDLFSERIVAKRYPDAGSCLTLAAELLEDEPSDSAARKLFLQNAKQLQACESKGIAKGGALKRGYISETDEPIQSAPNGAEHISDKQSAIASSRRLTGFTGLFINAGYIDYTTKYSPSYRLQVFHHDDKIIAIDGVSLQGLSYEVVSALCKGVAGTVAHVEYQRGSEVNTAAVPRLEYPSLNGLEKLSAKDKYELGIELREVGNVSGACIALEQAVSMDPTGDAGIRAKKVLLARMPRFEPPPQAMNVYRVAFSCRMNHDYVKAEALFRYLIKEWPKYEWPYKQLADILINENRLSDAEVALNQLKALNPDYARGWRTWARLKKIQGDEKGAQECYKHALELDPDDDLGKGFQP